MSVLSNAVLGVFALFFENVAGSHGRGPQKSAQADTVEAEEEEEEEEEEGEEEEVGLLTVGHVPYAIRQKEENTANPWSQRFSA